MGGGSASEDGHKLVTNVEINLGKYLYFKDLRTLTHWIHNPVEGVWIKGFFAIVPYPQLFDVTRYEAVEDSVKRSELATDTFIFNDSG